MAGELFERAPAPMSRMDFDDGPLSGLVIIYRPAPMSTVSAATAALEAYRNQEKVSPLLIAALHPLAEELAALVVAWNLTESGVAVPVSQFMSQPAAFVFRIAERWMLDIFDIPRGGTAEDVVDEAAEIEAEIPMDALPKAV